jgi:hypothetical protein
MCESGVPRSQKGKSDQFCRLKATNNMLRAITRQNVCVSGLTIRRWRALDVEILIVYSKCYNLLRKFTSHDAQNTHVSQQFCLVCATMCSLRWLLECWFSSLTFFDAFSSILGYSMVQIVVFAEVCLLVHAHTICRALRSLLLFVCENSLSESWSSMPFMGYPVRTSYLMPVPASSPPLLCPAIMLLVKHFSTATISSEPFLFEIAVTCHFLSFHANCSWVSRTTFV